MALHRKSQILIYFYVYSICKNLTREKFPNKTLKKVLQEKSLLTFIGVKMVALENMA